MTARRDSALCGTYRACSNAADLRTTAIAPTDGRPFALAKKLAVNPWSASSHLKGRDRREPRSSVTVRASQLPLNPRSTATPVAFRESL
jgi:hypothetical protein